MISSYEGHCQFDFAEGCAGLRVYKTVYLATTQLNTKYSSARSAIWAFVFLALNRGWQFGQAHPEEVFVGLNAHMSSVCYPISATKHRSFT